MSQSTANHEGIPDSGTDYFDYLNASAPENYYPNIQASEQQQQQQQQQQQPYYPSVQSYGQNQRAAVIFHSDNENCKKCGGYLNQYSDNIVIEKCGHSIHEKCRQSMLTEHSFETAIRCNMCQDRKNSTNTSVSGTVLVQNSTVNIPGKYVENKIGGSASENNNEGISSQFEAEKKEREKNIAEIVSNVKEPNGIQKTKLFGARATLTGKVTESDYGSVGEKGNVDYLFGIGLNISQIYKYFTNEFVDLQQRGFNKKHVIDGGKLCNLLDLVYMYKLDHKDIKEGLELSMDNILDVGGYDSVDILRYAGMDIDTLIKEMNMTGPQFVDMVSMCRENPSSISKKLGMKKEHAYKLNLNRDSIVKMGWKINDFFDTFALTEQEKSDYTPVFKDQSNRPRRNTDAPQSRRPNNNNNMNGQQNRQMNQQQQQQQQQQRPPQQYQNQRYPTQNNGYNRSFNPQQQQQQRRPPANNVVVSGVNKFANGLINILNGDF